MKKILKILIVTAICLITVTPVKAETFATVKQCIATGYCLKGTTATGTYTREGVIAYMPQYFGSTVYVFEDIKGDGSITADGYIGTYSCEDTGNTNIKDKGTVCDIWFSQYSDAVQFGSKKVILVIVPSEG